MQPSHQPNWRRFVSEQESNAIIGQIAKEKADHERGLADLDRKIETVADWLSMLSAAIKQADDKPSDLNRQLGYASAQGFDVSSIGEMIAERSRLRQEIGRCTADLRKRGINL
jgi:hypothetical protein